MNKLADIEVIITIFEEYPLWTHKQLNFESFKLAFYNRKDLVIVIDIRNNMNNNRTDYSNYIKPNVKDLSPYWIVGFTEGDGSFSISNLIASFSLTQKDKEILRTIRQYLITNDKLDNNNSFFSLSNLYSSNRKNTAYSLIIRNQYIIYKCIMPFFITKKLVTRKGYDFFI